MDRLLTEFMNLLFFFRGPRAWKGEKLLGSVLFFFPTFSQLEGNRLARSFRAPKGCRKASPSFSRRPLPAAVWSALAVDTCRIGGTLAAVLTLVVFQACLRPSSFLAPSEGGVRSWVILLFPQAGTERSKTGEADDTMNSRLKPMFVDGARVRARALCGFSHVAVSCACVSRLLHAQLWFRVAWCALSHLLFSKSSRKAFSNCLPVVLSLQLRLLRPDF